MFIKSGAARKISGMLNIRQNSTALKKGGNTVERNSNSLYFNIRNGLKYSKKFIICRFEKVC